MNDQTQIISIRGLNDCSIHINFCDRDLCASVVTSDGVKEISALMKLH